MPVEILAEHLRLARRHLVEAQARIRRQAELVEALEAKGQPSELARALLASFEETLVQFRRHEDLLEAAVRQ